MSLRREQQFDAFERYQDGDDDALITMLEIERPYLFDYLLRMTGQVEVCREAIDDSFRYLRESNEISEEPLQTALAKIYIKARNSCADVWNADTSELENIGIEAEMNVDLETQLSSTQPSLNDKIADLRKLDASIQKMSGAIREPLILHAVVGFTGEQVAQMFGVQAEMVEARVSETLTSLSEEFEMQADYILRAIGDIPLHVVPGQTKAATIALSQMIEQVDEASKKFISWRKIFLALIVMTLVVATLYSQGFFTSLIE
jgi:DNA-directed RNA polymerase specialized sigma24 family protein